MNGDPGKIKPPTKIGRQFVRYVVGFGVGVAIGLAPYLGKLDIPLFTPLLNLIPITIQDTVLPLSAALMGIVAVVVEWYGREKITKSWLNKAFIRSLILTLVAFVILICVHTMFVVNVSLDGGTDSVSILVGYERPIKEPCTEDVSDSECIKLITLNPSEISALWGDKAIKVAKLALILSYLTFTGLFGSSVSNFNCLFRMCKIGNHCGCS